MVLTALLGRASARSCIALTTFSWMGCTEWFMMKILQIRKWTISMHDPAMVPANLRLILAYSAQCLFPVLVLATIAKPVRWFCPPQR